MSKPSAPPGLLPQQTTDHGTRFLAIWSYDRAGFATPQHPPELHPERHEGAACVERIAERDVHVVTWRTTFREASTNYSVPAHWVLRNGVWIQLAADVFSRAEQEEALALLHTLSIEPLS